MDKEVLEGLKQNALLERAEARKEKDGVPRWLNIGYWNGVLATIELIEEGI